MITRYVDHYFCLLYGLNVLSEVLANWSRGVFVGAALNHNTNHASVLSVDMWKVKLNNNMRWVVQKRLISIDGRDGPWEVFQEE